MLTVWRLLKTRHATKALDGEGAASLGGRWNSPGVKVVYASESLALAALELLVRIGTSRGPVAYSSMRVEFDAPSVVSVAQSALPSGWRSSPSQPELRAIGDHWIKGRESLLLRVPSVIVPTENNYLLNPSHPAFSSANVHPAEPFEFDPRLLRGG
jgi:RES domain-containing protein